VRIGLDARTLAAEQRSGVEQYVINLVRALAGLGDAPETIAYTDRPVSDSGLAAIVSSPPFRTSVLRARRGWLQIALPWRLWRDGADLVHLPSTILPRLLPCPAVVTVHDLAWKRFPETYDPADLRMQEVALRCAARAAHIISGSETTARDLEQAGLPRDRITVIPLGVSPVFSPAGPRLSGDAFPWLRQCPFKTPRACPERSRRVLQGPRGAAEAMGGYLLYTGRLRPRKNLSRLIEAYRQVRDQVAAPPLVLSGGLTAHAGELQAQAGRLGLAEHVIFAGYVPDDLLPALYRGATAFVYPSLYEGFALPVLEAMASGVPVVTSSNSATAEVAGEAALLVHPESTAEIASGLVRLLSDQALREDLARRGLARSSRFTWERTARETTGVYRGILRQ